MSKKDADKQKPKEEQKSTKKENKKKQQCEEACAELEEKLKSHPLTGKTIRLISESVPAAVRDKLVKVTGALEEAGKIEFVRWQHESLSGRVSFSELVLPGGKWTQPFSDQVANLARFTSQEKAEICRGQSDLVTIQNGDLQDGPELGVAWAELFMRARQSSKNANSLDFVKFWHPQEACWVVDETVNDFEPDKLLEYLQFFKKELVSIKSQPKEKALLLIPVHSSHPPHWSLLAIERKAQTVTELFISAEEIAKREMDRWAVRYYDSLDNVSAELYKRIWHTLQVVKVAMELPAVPAWRTGDDVEDHMTLWGAAVAGPEGPVITANLPRQVDGWSCGLWQLKYGESELRRFLGEEPRAVKAPSPGFATEIARVNKIVQNMQKFLSKEKIKREQQLAKEAAMAAKQAVKEAAAAAAAAAAKAAKQPPGKAPAEPAPGQIGEPPVPAAPPPVPPPPAEQQVVHDASSSSSSGGTAVVAQHVITGGQIAGCSRCNLTVGCLSCVGWKAARHFRKKDKEVQEQEQPQ